MSTGNIVEIIGAVWTLNSPGAQCRVFTTR